MVLISKKKSSNEFADVVCPFCGLLCDDLIVNIDNGNLSMNFPDCKLAEQRFTSTFRPASYSCHANGTKCEFNEAVEIAAHLLTQAEFPVICGVMSDVSGARAAVELSDIAGAVIDVQGNHAFHRNSSRMQRSGYYHSTITEIRNRADLIVLIGNDISVRFPRLLDSLVPDRSCLLPDEMPRQVVFVGSSMPPIATTKSNRLKTDCIQCELGEVTSLISILARKLKGTSSQVDSVLCKNSLASLNELANQFSKANYSVIAWSAEEFDFPLGELALDALAELIDTVNKEKRCSGLSLSRLPSTVTANLVSTWQTGNPTPLSFRSGAPEFRGRHFSLDSLVDRDEVDLLVWVGGLEETIDLPDTEIDTVVISPLYSPASSVYIPVGIPGIDHRGHLFRTDQVVPLYLQSLRDSSLPSASKAVKVIIKTLKN